MQFRSVPVSDLACEVNAVVEDVLNRVVRGFDSVARPFGMSVRTSNYDDLAFAFVGGSGDRLRKAHYDKSLRLLWKAEQHASFTSFRDCSADEKRLLQMAEEAMDKQLRAEMKRVRSAEFRAELDRHYTPEQKQAIVNILATIAHGEAYAWIVSAELMGAVKSTGGRAAMTMQVLEEAKHFVVLREVLEAFGCEIPRMNVWEYIVLENIAKEEGLEKFFGMNVIVEGIALSIFGAMSSFPGLEVLRLFHLDESRHTALPHNYFHDFPMTGWQKLNPLAQVRRLALVAPAIPFLFRLEKDFATVGIDAFEFAGSVLRKVLRLSHRVGFHVVLPEAVAISQLNAVFNLYCWLTRPDHEFTDFMAAEATLGEAELEVEKEIFGIDPAARGATSPADAVLH